jgi:copper(I)-binding protein
MTFGTNFSAKRRLLGRVAAAMAASVALCASAATVEVRDATARATVTGQKASGVYMKLKSAAAMRLIGASTPLAGVTQLHEMRMEGDVMRMREVTTGLELPAGKVVELKPGGHHIMLMDLKQPLAKGGTVPLTLVFQDARGATSTMKVQVPVTDAAGGAAASTHKH